MEEEQESDEDEKPESKEKCPFTNAKTGSDDWCGYTPDMYGCNEANEELCGIGQREDLCEWSGSKCISGKNVDGESPLPSPAGSNTQSSDSSLQEAEKKKEVYEKMRDKDLAFKAEQDSLQKKLDDLGGPHKPSNSSDGVGATDAADSLNWEQDASGSWQPRIPPEQSPEQPPEPLPGIPPINKEPTPLPSDSDDEPSPGIPPINKKPTPEPSPVPSDSDEPQQGGIKKSKKKKVKKTIVAKKYNKKSKTNKNKKKKTIRKKY